jgi:hypothetical protein
MVNTNNATITRGEMFWYIVFLLLTGVDSLLLLVV